MDLSLQLVPCALIGNFVAQLLWVDQELSFTKLSHLPSGDLPEEENSRKPTQTIGNGAKSRTL